MPDNRLLQPTLSPDTPVFQMGTNIPYQPLFLDVNVQLPSALHVHPLVSQMPPASSASLTKPVSLTLRYLAQPVQLVTYLLGPWKIF